MKIITYGQFVFLRQLIHTQDSNDILEGLVVLKNLLNRSGNVIVLLADNTGIQHTRLRVQGVNRGVDTEFGNTTGQHSSCIQMGEGGSGSRICQIIGGDIDSLHGGNGSLLRGGDTLLPTTWLIQPKKRILDGSSTYMPPMSVDSVGW